MKLFDFLSDVFTTKVMPSEAKAHIGSNFRMSFEKEADNRWYAVIPQWKGAHAQLAMVDGADIFLDRVGHGKRLVTLDVTTEPKEDAIKLTKIEGNWLGATYLVTNCPEYESQRLWLCNVCRWVMGGHPDTIYAKLA